MYYIIQAWLWDAFTTYSDRSRYLIHYGTSCHEGMKEEACVAFLLSSVRQCTGTIFRYLWYDGSSSEWVCGLHLSYQVVHLLLQLWLRIPAVIHHILFNMSYSWKYLKYQTYLKNYIPSLSPAPGFHAGHGFKPLVGHILCKDKTWLLSMCLLSCKQADTKGFTTIFCHIALAGSIHACVNRTMAA